MAATQGKLASIGIGKESTQGTAVTPTFWVPVMKKEPGIVAEYANDESDYGNIMDTVTGDVVYSKGEPAFEGVVYDKSFGLLLLSALGAVSTGADTPEAGVNTHTFTLDNDVDHPSLTVAFKDANQDYCIPYSKLTSLELDFQKRGLIKYNAKFMGQKKESDSNTVAYTVENHFNSTHFSFKLATTVAGLAGASAIDVISFKMSFEKEIVENDALGSAEPVDIYNTKQECKVEFEMIMKNTTYQALYEAGTIQALKVALVNDDVTIGSATNPSLTITLDRLQLQEMDGGYDNGEIVKKKFTGKVHFDAAAGSGITAVLVNTQASY